MAKYSRKPPKDLQLAFHPDEEIIPVPVIDPETHKPVVQEEQNFHLESLEKQIEEKYDVGFVKLLKRIAYEISVIGLPLDEACAYVGIPYEEFMVYAQSELVQKVLAVKDLEYKRNLLKPISRKAQSDDKLAMWLLERRFPNEFNARKGTHAGDGGGEDLIGVALKFIQTSGDNQPLVNTKSATAFILKKGDGEKEMKKLADTLK